MEEDFELTLFDRLEMIRTVLKDIPDEQIYVSFSGGKDSTVLSHLVDEALPGNKIERVFSNTGIELNAIVGFVKEQQKKDDRIKIIYPMKNIKEMLEEKGYPFKSKLHSEYVERYQRSGLTGISVQKYVGTGAEGRRGRFNCPKSLLYQFDPDFKIKISQRCCEQLKKKPIKEYEKKHGKTMCLTGVRANEKGIREYRASVNGCLFRDKRGRIDRFNPLSPVSNEFVDWYVETRNIELCELYGEPYNFARTGCKGCPFNVHVGDELKVLKDLLPAEYKQCWKIWKPVYDEYVRIGYRKVEPYSSPDPSKESEAKEKSRQ